MRQRPGQSSRVELLDRAVALSLASVAFGAVSGGLSVTGGLRDHSLGVLGAGLGALADLVGSVVLTWRFATERRGAADPTTIERAAGRAIAAALGLVGVVLAVESIAALANGSHPRSSTLALAAAGLAVLGLTPLATLKRRTAAGLGSHALRGDSTLSAIGAATALLALAGLGLYRLLGWWWADRVVGLLVAGLAAAESYAISGGRRHDGG